MFASIRISIWRRREIAYAHHQGEPTVLSREFARNRRADSSRSTGDEDNFSSQARLHRAKILHVVTKPGAGGDSVSSVAAVRAAPAGPRAASEITARDVSTAAPSAPP